MERQTNANSYYTVIVSDGEIADNDLRRIAPSVRHSCGHNHRSEDAAMICRTHLRAERCEGCHRSWATCRCRNPRRVASAKWYNSIIHAHARDSMAYLR